MFKERKVRELCWNPKRKEMPTEVKASALLRVMKETSATGAERMGGREGQGAGTNDGATWGWQLL